MNINFFHSTTAACKTPAPRQPNCHHQRLERGFPTAWILLLLLALPGAVQAQFTFTTNSGAITITGYTGPGGAVVIPGSINGYPVCTIGDSAFESCTTLTSVTIPDSVTSIEDCAFWLCSSLTSVTMPDTVTNIGVILPPWVAVSKRPRRS